MNKKTKNSKSLSNKAKKNSSNGTSHQLLNRSGIRFDKIDTKILQEIIKNSNVKSSEIAVHINVPLSTIQRRRRRIEDSTMLEKKFLIDTRKIGLRTADLLIKVSKGEIDSVADHIVNEHSKSVLEVSSRVGQVDTNLAVRVVYKDSDELFQIINKINKIEYVESIQWSEIVNIIHRNEIGLVENMLKLSASDL